MNEKPWIAKKAVSFLESAIAPNSRVFEYGSGGSTLFFARRAQEIVSVEHDPVWFQRMEYALLSRGYRNHTVRLIVPPRDDSKRAADPSDPASYVSGRRGWRGFDFQKYASAIDSYPDDYFDIVLVDGRARPSCCRHALPKVRSGGHLILDDSHRTHYRYIQEILDSSGWTKRCHLGWRPSPSFTCIWQKRPCP